MIRVIDQYYYTADGMPKQEHYNQIVAQLHEAACKDKPMPIKELEKYIDGKNAVEGKFGEKWYPGVIKAVNDDGTYKIRWTEDDGRNTTSKNFPRDGDFSRLREVGKRKNAAEETEEHKTPGEAANVSPPVVDVVSSATTLVSPSTMLTGEEELRRVLELSRKEARVQTLKDELARKVDTKQNDFSWVFKKDLDEQIETLEAFLKSLGSNGDDNGK